VGGICYESGANSYTCGCKSGYWESAAHLLSAITPHECTLVTTAPSPSPTPNPTSSPTPTPSPTPFPTPQPTEAAHAPPNVAQMEQEVALPLRLTGFTSIEAFTPAARVGVRVAVARLAGVHRDQVALANIRYMNTPKHRARVLRRQLNTSRRRRYVRYTSFPTPVPTSRRRRGVSAAQSDGIDFDAVVVTARLSDAGAVTAKLAAAARAPAHFTALLTQEMVGAVRATGGDVAAMQRVLPAVLATPAPVVAHPGEEGAPALVQTRLPQEGAAAEAPAYVLPLGVSVGFLTLAGALWVTFRHSKRVARRAPNAHDEALEEQVQQLQQRERALEQRVLEAEVNQRFRESLANTHPGLFIKVTAVRVLAPGAALETGYAHFEQALPADSTPMERMRRDVFHTCPDDVLPLIEAHGMRPSHCAMCRGLAPMAAHDCGWFGDHSKGVYVSKHADYTMYYQRGRDPQPGDEGTVLMLDLITGRVQHFDQRRDGAPPTPGFHCHETPNHLEFYVWDDETIAEPPRPTHRLVPRYAVSWRAVRNDRAGIQHDGNGGDVLGMVGGGAAAAVV